MNYIEELVGRVSRAIERSNLRLDPPVDQSSATVYDLPPPAPTLASVPLSGVGVGPRSGPGFGPGAAMGQEKSSRMREDNEGASSGRDDGVWTKVLAYITVLGFLEAIQ
jgi:hypothetical protein